MTHNTATNSITSPRFRRSKQAFKWLLIGLITVFAVAILAPFFISQAEHINAGADFVKAHPIGFAFARLVLYAAAIYYWPALIRWRFRKKDISPDFLAALQHRGRPIRLLIAFELLTSVLPLIMNL